VELALGVGMQGLRVQRGVGEVEEFYSKLSQIGGANVKGGFASAGPLQRGALQYAKSKGIAVLRIRPRKEIEWVSYCRIGEPRVWTLEEFYEYQMTSESLTVENIGPVHGFSTQGWCHDSIDSLVEEEIQNNINATLHPLNQPFDSEEFAVERIAKWLGSRPWKLNDSPIHCSYVEKVLGLPQKSAETLIPRAAARFNLFLDRLEGDMLFLIRKKQTNRDLYL
jgi:hypothetical protein